MDTIGGAQVHVRDISIAMQECGNTIYLVSGGTKNVHTEVEKSGVNLIYSPHLIRQLHLVSDIKAIFEVRKIIKKVKPDIIATHSSKAGIIGRLAGWSLRIPTTFTAHGWSFTEGVPKSKKRLYIFFEKVIGLISNGVITVSEYDKQLARKYKVLPENTMTTIHNGVHDIAKGTRIGLTGDYPKIIMVARFAPPKQQLKLLQALDELRHIQWKMYFAGDGPQIQDAKNYVENSNLTDRVFFLGSRGDIINLLNQSDLFILLSEWEGLPLSILEAMRCNLPILASNVGGVKEAVLQTQNGYLVSKDDEFELRDKLLRLLTNPSLRIEMGNRSRKIYEEKFRFELMHEKTMDFYEKTIHKRR